MKKGLRAIEWSGAATLDARATLIGRDRALIENFSGMIEFSREKLRLSARGGEIVVTGEGIEIEQARPGSLIVRGRIDGVTLPGRDNG